MAFYGRLKDKVFPDGPSKNWSDVTWDPSKGTKAAPTVPAAAAPAAAS